MKANELRIGNYLQIEDMNGLAKVYSISNMIDESISVFYYQEGKNRKTFHCIDRFNPIPLTEEWLLKLDFTKGDYDGVYEKDINSPHNYTKIEIMFIRNAHIIHLKYGDANECAYGTFKIKNDIKHVHQLQNLFYAITGEELTIKSENN